MSMVNVTLIIKTLSLLRRLKLRLSLVTLLLFIKRQCRGSLDSFFFQAEDGIRDTSVTGVQTCALPILIAISEFVGEHVAEVYGVDPDRLRTIPRGVDLARFDPRRVWGQQVAELAVRWRWEERRVGKECGSGCVPAPERGEVEDEMLWGV